MFSYIKGVWEISSSSQFFPDIAFFELFRQNINQLPLVINQMGLFDKLLDINLTRRTWKIKVRATKVWSVPPNSLPTSAISKEIIFTDVEVVCRFLKLSSCDYQHMPCYVTLTCIHWCNLSY